MKAIAIAAERKSGVKENYFAAVEATGAEAVALALQRRADAREREAYITSVLARVDGIVMTGGQDLDPALYGADNTASVMVDREEDDFELAVIDHAVRQGLPILAICRGMQLVNVYFGGTLTQQVARGEIHEWHDGADRLHPARAGRGSFLHTIYGKETMTVNSAHHQAIAVLGKGLVAVQHSEDGVIEAVYHETHPILGVQWHPERICLQNARKGADDGLALFSYFTERITTGGA